MNQKALKPKKKKMLGLDVRIIEIEDEVWVAEQDVFRNLGRLREDEQIRGEDRKKVTEFLGNIDKLSSVESFNITTGGKGKS